MKVHAHASQFVDDFGRQVMLRGVNLGGSSKVPAIPNGATHLREGFFTHRQVSFVGRPFPLDQAHEHFSRLRRWGFNFLRLLITWEAIEHAGPGLYDEQYLDYITEVVRLAGEYGFTLFIDPHQDVWSRFCGGDGAPGWTLEAVGFDMNHLSNTGAAIVHATHPGVYPRMVWSSNYTKLACATMFTLFFAGNDFAPQLRINGESAQDYLQRHYISAVQQIAMRINHLPHVLGYDTMNEPSPGYIGWKDLNSLGGLVNLDASPTPYQSMLLAVGLPQEVDVYSFALTGIKKSGSLTLNKIKECAWQPGYDCIWKQHGVWDFDASGAPHLLKPDYFAQVDGRQVDFLQEYYRTFNNRFAQAINSVHPEALIFIESEPMSLPYQKDAQDAQNLVYAPHWYDGIVVMTKEYNPLIGSNSLTRRVVFGPAIRRSYRQQLATLKNSAEHQLGGVPVVLGEFGIPFDLHEKQAYQTGNFRLQVKAMQRSLRAVEDNLLNYTLWNYTPDNNNSYGDQWNNEDFSIYSPDQRSDLRDINSGGRGLQAVVRPYPLQISGTLLKSNFYPFRRIFRMKFRHDPAITAPSEIFVPDYQYPHGYTIKVSDGRYEINRSDQTLLYWPGEEKSDHQVIIKP